MALREGIMMMDDGELIAALAIIGQAPHLLSDWEKDFVEQMPKIWERHGSITWKQRKYARQLVDKLWARLERRTTQHRRVS